jgi:hypothetical protein
VALFVVTGVDVFSNRPSECAVNNIYLLCQIVWLCVLYAYLNRSAIIYDTCIVQVLYLMMVHIGPKHVVQS